VKFSFIDVEKANFPVKTLCKMLEVSTSGYYASRKRGPSKRSRENEALLVRVKAIHAKSRGTYGSPRIREEIVASDALKKPVSRKRIARLMREAGIEGRCPKRFRRTTNSEHEHPIAENRLERDFTASAPNRAWVTDITYVRTWEGWLYLAVVIDLFSRRVVGWAIAPHMRTELVLDALRMALGRRVPSANLVHHSDRGCQYASTEYRSLLQQHAINCSMSRTGDCWDNAVAESFFATLKTELIYLQAWPTRRGACREIAEFIELFYNNERRHSYLGYLSPAEYERAQLTAARAA